MQIRPPFGVMSRSVFTNDFSIESILHIFMCSDLFQGRIPNSRLFGKYGNRLFSVWFDSTLIDLFQIAVSRLANWIL